MASFEGGLRALCMAGSFRGRPDTYRSARGRVHRAPAGLTVLLAALGALSLAACLRGEPAHPTARSYTVRGEVVRLPDAARPGDGTLVRHEAIPGFTDAAGAVVGMASMVMPFAMPPGAAPADLGVGDKVVIRFTIDFSNQPSFRVDRVERLPPATELHFAPPGSAALP